jgi:hypothetical protein
MVSRWLFGQKNKKSVRGKVEKAVFADAVARPQLKGGVLDRAREKNEFLQGE